MSHKNAALEDTLYFYFAANDTSGSGDDGASPLYDVRLGGAAASAAPVLSGTPDLLTHANYPAGAHEIAVAATTANGFVDAGKYGVFCTLAVDSQNPTGAVGEFTLTALATADQVGLLTSGTAAISTVSGSFVKAGAEPETGTYTNTAALDGVFHIVEDDSTSTDVYYEFSVGGNGVPVSVKWDGYANPGTSTYDVFAYNFGGTAWEQIGTLDTKNDQKVKERSFDMTISHVGTGSDIGKVRFRIESSDGTAFGCDRLLCSYAVVAESVGYALGRIWVNTNDGVAGAVKYVNGVADNAVLTWANALTLSAPSSVNITDFNIINGGSIALSANSDNYSIFGDNYSVALAGQSCVDIYIQGASVSGIGVAASGLMHFEGCSFGTVSVQAGHFDVCDFSDTVTHTLAGDYNYHNCYSGVAGAGSPIFTKTAGQTITSEWRNFAGGITVSGIESGDVMTIGGTLGTVTLNGADGTVEIRGTYKAIVDNRTGSPTLNTEGALNEEALIDANWEEPIAGHLTAGTTGLSEALGSAAIADTTVTGTPTSTALQLTAGSTTDDFYNDQLIYVLSGTGIGQVRAVLSYTGATKTVVIDEPWITTPAATDRVAILVSHVHPITQIQAGLATEAKQDIIDANVDSILVDTDELQTNQGAWATATGFATEAKQDIINTNVDSILVDTGTTLPATLATIAAYLDTEIAAILLDTGTTLPAQIAALNNISAAQVNAEVVDALSTDTYAELASIPAATASITDKITLLYMMARNKVEQTSTTKTLRADNGTTSVGAATVSDDGTTFIDGEIS